MGQMTNQEALEWIRFRTRSAKMMKNREWMSEAYGMASMAHAVRLITDEEYLEIHDEYCNMLLAETGERE